MTDPQQQVRAMVRGVQAAYLDRDLWRAFLRSMALPSSGKRAPKEINFLGATVRPHELFNQRGERL
jgi:hypothetical protein